MSYTITLFMFVCLGIFPNGKDACSTAHQEATYSFQHTKKALEGHNVALLKLSAKRAIESIERVKNTTEECGCTDANNASYDALDNLSKAMEKAEFEASRFYVNRAHKNSKQIIEFLEVCEQTGLSSSFKAEEEDLQLQERQLLEEQKRLKEQQLALQRQMEQQLKLQEEIQLKKEAELTQQVQLKEIAEKSLQDFESVIADLTRGMDCPKVYNMKQNYKKAVAALEKESLLATKQFYADKARELALQLINTLDACEE